VVIFGLLAIAGAEELSADPIENLIPTYGADLLPSYSELDSSASLPGYNDLDTAASAPMSGEDMLRMSVPGNPGEDYPIYSEVPDTGFDCEGRFDGGYYADPGAECQAFHICTADGTGGLAIYSFLCPNGTLFNQENFVCEYWFNVDCSQAESLYSLNENIGQTDGSGGGGLDGSASSPSGGYSSPGSAAAPSGGYTASSPVAPAYVPPASPVEDYASAASAPASYEEETDTGYTAPTSPIDSSYGGPSDESLPGYGGAQRRGKKQGGGRPGGSRVSGGGNGGNNGNRRKQQQPGGNGNFAQTLTSGRFSPRGGVSDSGRQGRQREESQGSRQGQRLSGSENNRKSKKLSESSSRKENSGQGQRNSSNRSGNNRQSKTFTDNRRQNQKLSESGSSSVNSKQNQRNSQSQNRSENNRKSKTIAESSGRFGNTRQNQRTFESSSKSVGQSGGRRGKNTGAASSGQSGRAGRNGGRSQGVSSLAPTTSKERNGGRNNQGNGRNNNGRGKNGRGNNRGGARRGGRQETGGALQTGYGAPVETGYGAPAVETGYGAPPVEEGYGAPPVETGYGAPALDTGYGAPPPNSNSEAAAAPVDGYQEPTDYDGDDYEYDEEPLPTYNKASATAGQSSYIAPIASDSAYSAPVSPGSSYGAPGESPESSYSSPDSSYGAPSVSPDSSYGAPPVSLDSSYGAPGSVDTSYAAGSGDDGDYEYEEDILPTYNNGVYNDGTSGSNYQAPKDDPVDSYSAPLNTGYGAPASDSGAPPAPGGYNDPEADILPEYYKSEITLGLNSPQDVPRVEPFLSDYGQPRDTYTSASSFSSVAVAQPDLTYGVPAAPTISLEDYNIPEVSDLGFTGSGSSYGR